MRKMRTVSLLVSVTLVSGGCYQYIPVAESAPLPQAGAEVRVRLESPQALDLGTMTINDVSLVEGHIHRSGDDTLSVFANNLRTFYGFRQHTNGAVFYFDRSQFRMLEQRKLVLWKTAVATGTTVEGLGFLMHFALGLGEAGETGDPAPPPPNAALGTPVPMGIRYPCRFLKSNPKSTEKKRGEPQYSVTRLRLKC